MSASRTSIAGSAMRPSICGRRPEPRCPLADPSSSLEAMRKVFALVAAIVFVDTAFYAAIVPLLPHYVDRLDLSQTQAGILTASYAAGTLIASLPGGMCAARFGVRPTVLAGLSLMACSSLVFGFGTSAPVLDAARFAQGIGGAFSWA